VDPANLVRRLATTYNILTAIRQLKRALLRERSMEGREKATDLGVKFVPKSKPAKHGMAFPSIPQSRNPPHLQQNPAQNSRRALIP
jgi:hypothetical protein